MSLNQRGELTRLELVIPTFDKGIVLMRLHWSLHRKRLLKVVAPFYFVLNEGMIVYGIKNRINFEYATLNRKKQL